jgi:oligosaccharyltransferase complex subunit beta
MWRGLLLLGLAAAAGLHGAQAAGKSVLMLLGNAKDEDQFSTFLGDLKIAGFSVEVKGVKDSGLKLREYGVWAYDHLVLFAPKAESEPASRPIAA